MDVFSSSGLFEAQLGEGVEGSGVAVDEASGDVYVSAGSAVDVFKPDGSGGYELLSEWSGAGTPAGEFGEAAGVAVDNSSSASDPHAGDVYVVDGANGAVDAFQPKPSGAQEAQEGSFVGVLSGAKLEQPNGVAVDSATGGVYVADSVKGVVDLYSSAGSFERKLTGAGSPNGTFLGVEEEEGNVAAVAVEEATGDVYVAERERHVVSQFAASGEWLGWITVTPSGPLVEPDGVALSGSADVYLADAGAGSLDLFGAGVVVADTTTDKATKVGKTSALMTGVVDGDGKPAKYRFQWGSSQAYGQSTPTQAAGGDEEKISAEVSGLTPGSTYHFRLVSENENGINVGANREFTTLPAVDALSTGPAQGTTPTTATLTGSLTPDGVDAHYYFQWGPSSSYGNTSPAPPGIDAGAGKEAVTAETDLSGLAPNTTYHYRLIGEDQYGSTDGEDARFTTPGPPRITSEPTTGVTHEAATINAKVDPDELETSYHFEYGETISYGSEIPLGGAKLAAGETPVSVSATLGALKIGTSYHYRLVATNSAGSTYTRDQTFNTVPPALIEDTSATEVSASEATLAAQIDPLGHDTTYYLQYGTEPCKPDPSACTSIPTPPGTDIGAGETPIPISQHLGELKPATTYHYRALALNSLGTTEGPEHTLTTREAQPPFALPDHRAWEMVTPPNKHGAPIEALTREGGVILAAENGNSITYVADGPITEEPPGNRSPEQQQIFSTRTAEGWRTEDIATPNSRAQGVSPGSAPEYQFFTPDLSLALVEPWGTSSFSEPPLAPEARQTTMYLRNDASGTYLPLVTEANVPAGTKFGHQIRFVLATPDLSHVIIHANVPLTEGQSGPGLYEWESGVLKDVSVLPSGAPASSAELGFDGHVLAHAISTDGTRVVWTLPDESAEGAQRGHLYLRDSASGETIQLDAAQGVAEPGIGSAQFQTASADDSRVLFTDKQRLTADSTSEPAQGVGKSDLYECEVIRVDGKLSCRLKDLTVADSEGGPAAVQGLIFGASEDGSSVYLVAQGVLASNENGNQEIAEAGQDNLYSLHESDGNWTTTFIARLSSEDGPEWEGNKDADTAFLSASVSPDGRYLAFMSAASPTGYDNVDASPEAKGARAEEVYLYDSGLGRLTCVSCNPTGGRPIGTFDTVAAGEGIGLLVDRRKIWTGHWLAGNVPGWTAQSLPTATSLVGAIFQSRYLADSGRLFFNSPDDLVAQATNHKEDVYEYEPAGVGTCESSTGACVSLISSGSSSRESAFLEATPDGSSAFFLTAAQLLPQDTDTAFDIYDARVCTSESPCLTPPAPAPPACGEIDACRPAEPAQPAPPGPAGTATTSGAGNAPTKAPPAVGGVNGARTSKSKPLTRAQKLARALGACRRLKHKRERVACARRARRAYDSKESAKRPARHTSAHARRVSR